MNGRILSWLMPGLLLCPVWGSAVWAQRPAVTAGDYERLLKGRFADPVPLPPGGVILELDEARWHLESGSVSFMEPTSSGVVTGLVFTGSGRFELDVPDAIELRQLRRFAEDPELMRVDERFDRMVLRTSIPGALGVLSELEVPLGSAMKPNDIYAGRQKIWLLHHRFDCDSRVLAALRTQGDGVFRAEMDTDSYGWLTFDYDRHAPEEIRLWKFKKGRAVLESWLSLDRREDRTDEGLGSSKWTGVSKLVHFDVKVDLTEAGKGGARGVAAVNPLNGRFAVDALFQSRLDGMGALKLQLSPIAVLSSVSRVGGGELPFFRYRVGALSGALDNRLHHNSFVVLLDDELAQEDHIELHFEYELEVPGYGSLLSWYPRPQEMGLELHTYSIEATHRKSYGFKAVGEFVEQRSTDGGPVTSVWRAIRPVDAVAFTVARLPHEKSYTYEGLPEIVMFGSQAGYMSAEKIEGFSADIINSVNYFQRLFGTDVSTPKLNVTFIGSGHGQAGQGLIHISDSIAQAALQGQAREATREAFLAHEVAHEWWGHQVSWASYRDQWLSEGFAEYAAAMFVEASLDGGPRIFRHMLRAYNDELIGSIASAFGASARPGLALDNKAARDRIGPIGHGYRASVAEAPAAYISMAYSKGAMVLHMLRVIMRTITKSDEAFLGMLSDFVQTYQGKAASTADFQRVLTKHAPSDWTWFFDQWVYATHIPSFKWEHELEKGSGGKWLLRLHVEMDDVPPGFKTPVPVRAEFGKDQHSEILVMVDEPMKDFELTLPARPKKVVFNPDHSILARMR